jgi:hypothetical protein
MVERLLAAFPRLRTTPFRVTSPADESYNCIAWAAGDSRNWWWPLAGLGKTFWPEGIARSPTLDAFVSAFAAFGYEADAGEEPEPGFEKVRSSPTRRALRRTRPGNSLPVNGRANWGRPRTSNTTSALWKAISTDRSPRS